MKVRTLRSVYLVDGDRVQRLSEDPPVTYDQRETRPMLGWWRWRGPAPEVGWPWTIWVSDDGGPDNRLVTTEVTHIEED